MKRMERQAGGENGFQGLKSPFIVPESVNILNLYILRIFLVCPLVTTERISRECNVKLNKENEFNLKKKHTIQKEWGEREKKIIQIRWDKQKKNNRTVGLNTNILNVNRPGSPNKCS